MAARNRLTQLSPKSLNKRQCQATKKLMKKISSTSHSTHSLPIAKRNVWRLTHPRPSVVIVPSHHQLVTRSTTSAPITISLTPKVPVRSVFRPLRFSTGKSGDMLTTLVLCVHPKLESLWVTGRNVDASNNVCATYTDTTARTPTTLRVSDATLRRFMTHHS